MREERLRRGLADDDGLSRLPGDLVVLSDWWVIGVAAALYLVEFLADKIAMVDSAWDAIHTFIRVPGAVLAATAFADFDPTLRVLAFLVGGGLALSSHGAKAATRVAVNSTSVPGTGAAVTPARRGRPICGLAPLDPFLTEVT
ncbi:MAG TPA: DUF4126 domain-containing protein [Methylomirabilota bacterium]|nr:DUF4126 domain-containing protein [Methylomirabilota bacterium]